jgi:hypothetical protein
VTGQLAFTRDSHPSTLYTFEEESAHRFTELEQLEGIDMARRLSFSFVFMLATAFIVVACGRQVTPNPAGLGPGGAPPGYVAIHYDVESPFNFSNYQYMVVFNTTGSGVTPSTDTQQTNWAGYSLALIALGNAGVSDAEALQYIPSQNPHVPPGYVKLGTTPNQLSYNPNSNGQGTEFSMIAQKSIIRGYASPSPSASPSNVWTFNAFVSEPSQGQWYFVDSLGAGGPIDPQFVSPRLCMTEPFDNTYYATDLQISDPTAEIVSVELSNNPVTPTPCP